MLDRHGVGSRAADHVHDKPDCDLHAVRPHLQGRHFEADFLNRVFWSLPALGQVADHGELGAGSDAGGHRVNRQLSLKRRPLAGNGL